MSKIFLIPQFEMERRDNVCFNVCGRITVGAIIDPDLGACFPCHHEDCEWEKDRMELGPLASDETVIGYARALKEGLK